MSRILVGVIGAPHGIRGEVRLKSYTARPTAIGGYGPLQAEGRPAPLVLRGVRPVKDDMLVARFEGVADRDAAAALNGLRLFIDRSALPEADDDEFYHADLIGLRAEAEDGTVLGQVRAIVNYGGGDLLEIAGEAPDTILIAFTRAFVPHVDVEGGRLVIAGEALVEGDAADDPGNAGGSGEAGDERPGDRG